MGLWVGSTPLGGLRVVKHRRSTHFELFGALRSPSWPRSGRSLDLSRIGLKSYVSQMAEVLQAVKESGENECLVRPGQGPRQDCLRTPRIDPSWHWIQHVGIHLCLHIQDLPNQRPDPFSEEDQPRGTAGPDAAAHQHWWRGATTLDPQQVGVLGMFVAGYIYIYMYIYIYISISISISIYLSIYLSIYIYIYS